MSEFARYAITEAAIEEVLELLEKIEAKADLLIKKCRKRSHFHVCEIRAQAFDFRASAQNIREYICDQIADQVQYTLTDSAMELMQRTRENNEYVYVKPNGNGTYTVIDPVDGTTKIMDEHKNVIKGE